LKIYETASSTAKQADTCKHAFSIQEIDSAGLFAGGAKRYGHFVNFAAAACARKRRIS
jgi:hypothetical protein